MGASREAFDLHNKSCREYFRHHIKEKWNKLWWWKLVYKDTINRVCSLKNLR